MATTMPITLPQCAVKLNGSDLPPEVMERLLECRVENSAHLPDLCVIRFDDEDLELTDGTRFEVGNPIEVSMGFGGRLSPVFYGEIVGLDLDLAAHHSRNLVVRCLHKVHRLHRVRKTRTFVNQKFSDIVSSVASEAGLSPEVESTTEIYDWIVQNNETNWEFVNRLAARCGYRVYGKEQNKLVFAKVTDPTSPRGTLKWGEDLHSFRVRLTASTQATMVTVRGWDWIQKQPITATATNDSGEPQIGLGRRGSQVARSAFGEYEHIVVNQILQSQAEAAALAQSVMDEIGGSFLEAEGLCNGDPRVLAGDSIEVENAGQRFSGTYFVTSSTHVFSAAEGYTTQFVVSGKQPATLPVGMPDPDLKERAKVLGVAVGIVTNNSDPENMGRVKVKFPWFDGSQESFWAKTCNPMAGPDRGFQFLPEINDEVLVAFEHGDMHHPYVLGGLWNQGEKPNQASDNNVKGGKVVQRTIRTRAGHYLLFDDNDGAENIYVKTCKGHEVKLDDGQKCILVKSKDGHTIKLDDQGAKIEVIDKIGSNKITIDSNANSIAQECVGNFEIKARGQVTIEGTAGVTVKTPASLMLDGSGMATLKSAGVLTVQGSMVKIN